MEIKRKHGKRPMHHKLAGVLVCLTLSSINAIGRGLERQASSEAPLQAMVHDFDNDGSPLIQTLFRIGRAYRLPLGIEMVTNEAIQRPISVRLQRGTVRQLLDLCVAQSPASYSWEFRDGLVHVYGADELEDPTNLLSVVLPRFNVQDEPLPEAFYALRSALWAHVLEAREERSLGVVGSYVWNPDHEKFTVTLALENATVRTVLKRLVAPFAGNFIWISRVPPDRLSDLPSSGLFQLVGPETNDPTALLEIEKP